MDNNYYHDYSSDEAYEQPSDNPFNHPHVRRQWATETPSPRSLTNVPAKYVTYESREYARHSRDLGHADMIQSSRIKVSTLPITYRAPDDTNDDRHISRPLQPYKVNGLSAFEDINYYTAAPPSRPYKERIGMGLSHPSDTSMFRNQAHNLATLHPQVHDTSGAEEIDLLNDLCPHRQLPTTVSDSGIDVPMEALNSRASRCTIHDEPCDGVTTTNKYLSQHARETGGIVQNISFIACSDGRVMVDWWKTTKEEQSNGRM